MRAHKLQVQIPADHHLSLELPPSFPAGPAEVIILTHAQEKRPILRAGSYLSAKVQMGSGDPVADALLEIRSEHRDLIPACDLHQVTHRTGETPKHHSYQTLERMLDKLWEWSEKTPLPGSQDR